MADGIRKQPLSADAQRALVLRTREGDHDAREQLIEAFRSSIAAMARRHRGATGVTHAELVQAGVLGLARALERYDPAFGVPFWAYASWWARQAMQDLGAN